MKIRSKFVSNSSSSSFVVAFSEIPQNVDDIRRILFGEEEFFHGPNYYEKSTYTTQQIAATVFSDFMEQCPATQKQIFNEFNHGYLDGEPEFPHVVDIENSKKEWKEWEEAKNKYSQKISNEFIEKNKGKYFFIFSYSDDNSYSGTLEHGDIFRNLDYYQISHH